MNTIPFETIDLIPLRLGSALAVDEETALHSPKLETWRDDICQRLVFQLRAYVWADQPKSVRHHYPRTWWDAFKIRWFPEWALEAYPPDYEITVLEAQHFYPKLKMEAPQFEPRLRMVVRKEA